MLRICALVLMMLPLTSCLAGAALSAAGAVVETTGAVVGAAVKTTGEDNRRSGRRRHPGR